ncbi:MAG: 1-acyl-sn-glycerol-3-phosphate acyltransferase [Prevotella sp.]|nr:1-acyl-sn-glycerol-3-phosphate acyltransferase [Prevotella sp.]
MTIPEAFDSIRPFEPEELPQAYDRLLADKQFVEVLAFLYPGVPAEAIAAKMRQCRTNLEFQKTFCYTFLEQLLLKVAKGCDMDTSQVDVTKRYTFVSNHRDIVLDSALLDKLLIDAGFTTTCEIAIGDNLLSLPWVRDLVRVNKAFIVERSLPPRQMLLASKRLAEYMHFAIAQKNENVWIAQREGRAKDSDDRTQPAILKMMAMGGEGSPAERLKQLHIVPLAISYEYDPCDFLKAKELQQRRDTTDFHKAPGDDVRSMQTGILGYKGRIHYHCAPCIDQFLDTVADMPKGELFDKVAAHIDQEIHRNYRLYPSNFIALDMLEGSNAHEDRYTKEDKAFFDKYLQGQLAKIDLEKPDHQFLRERMLTMYANPARNQLILSAK